MPYENVTSVVLFAYLNIEFTFTPTVKYSLAMFSSSCQIDSVCKQQVGSESVFAAVLNMYQSSA